MYARVTTLRAPKERVEEGVAHYETGISKVREIVGNRGAFLLVDRAAGRGIGVTLWASEGALQASRERADEFSGRVASAYASTMQAGPEVLGEIASVDEYEVAVWAVS